MAGPYLIASPLMQQPPGTNDIFRRHSRRQPPTLPGLNAATSAYQPLLARSQPIPIKRTPSWVPSKAQVRDRDCAKGPDGLPLLKSWSDFEVKYKLIQGECEHIVSVLRDAKRPQVMFKFKRADDNGSTENTDSHLSTRHANVLPVQYTINHNMGIYIGYESASCTLEEILSVNAPLDESLIQVVARSVSCKQCTVSD